MHIYKNITSKVIINKLLGMNTEYIVVWQIFFLYNINFMYIYCIRYSVFPGEETKALPNILPQRNYISSQCVLCLVAQLCLTLCDPMDSILPGSSVQGDSPPRNTGMGNHSLLQEVFLTQRSNLGLLYYRWILYCLNHQGNPSTKIGAYNIITLKSLW